MCLGHGSEAADLIRDGLEDAVLAEMLIRPLLRSAHCPLDCALLSDDDLSDEIESNWTIIPIEENRNFCIRTSNLEEKAGACIKITRIARLLGHALLPYVDDISELMLINIKFAFDEEVRTSAADTLPLLIACVGGVPAKRTLWVKFWSALRKAINQEERPAVICELINSVTNCIIQLGAEGVAEGELEEIGVVLERVMEGLEERREERDAAEDDAEGDELDELYDERDIDFGIMSRTLDLVCAGFQAAGDSFFHVVDPLIRHIVPFIDVSRATNEQLWGIRILCHILKSAPERTLKYQRRIARSLIQSLTCSLPSVRKAAARGFRVMAKHPKWVPSVVRAMHKLTSMLLEDLSLDEETTVEWALNEIRNNCFTLNNDETPVSSTAIRETSVNERELNNDNQAAMEVHEFGSMAKVSSGMLKQRSEETLARKRVHESPQKLRKKKRVEPIAQQCLEMSTEWASNSGKFLMSADAGSSCSSVGEISEAMEKVSTSGMDLDEDTPQMTALLSKRPASPMPSDQGADCPPDPTWHRIL